MLHNIKRLLNGDAALLRCCAAVLNGENIVVYHWFFVIGHFCRPLGTIIAGYIKETSPEKIKDPKAI